MFVDDLSDCQHCTSVSFFQPEQHTVPQISTSHNIKELKMASQAGADAASKAETKPTTEDKALEELGDVPDPDEDDLDDLDGM